jgi:hypothetical protein
MDAKLVIVGGQANKSEVKLKLPMLIGRNPGLGLTINHNMVSRVHCQIYEREGALVVRDNNSSNGTLINNERISEAILKPGDRLAVGPLTFVAIYQHNGPFPNVGRESAPKAAPAAPKAAPPAAKAPSMSAPAATKPAAKPTPAAPAKPAAPPAAPPAAAPAAKGQWSDSLFDEANTADDLLFGREEPASPFSKYTQPTVEEEEGTRFFAPGTSFKELDLADLVADTDDGSQSAVYAAPTKPATPTPSAAPAATDDFQFLIQFENAGDIGPGTPIRAAGRDAGTVKDMKYVPVGGKFKAQVLVSVSKQLAPHLRDDLSVAINNGPNGLLIEIVSPGQGKPLTAGQTVGAVGLAQQQFGGLEDLVDDSGIMSPDSLSAHTGGGDDDLGVLDESHGSSGDNIMAPPPAKGGGLTDFFAELTSGLDMDEDDDSGQAGGQQGPIPMDQAEQDEDGPTLTASFEDLAGDEPPMATLDIEEVVEELPPENGAPPENGDNGATPNQGGFTFGDFDVPGRR